MINRELATFVRFPFIIRYELEGEQTASPDIDAEVGGLSFASRELYLQAIDFAYTTNQRRRQGVSIYCPVTTVRRSNSLSLRDDTMREAIPIDARFPRLTLRPEATGAGRLYHESSQGLDAEVYNPGYFAALCVFAGNPRPCFQPIYGVGCRDAAEATYGAPVAFWTSVFVDRVADVPGAVGARSAVFGFAPVFFNPDEARPAIETILFDECQLPRKPEGTVSGAAD